MRRSEKSQVIRELLKRKPMTTTEISQITGYSMENLPSTLKSMPDTYIHDWKKHATGRRPSAIWAVVVPPPNARPPEKAR